MSRVSACVFAARPLACSVFDMKGQKLAILGPNGAGKSTLLKAMGGVLPLSAGERREGEGLQPGMFTQARDFFEAQLYYQILVENSLTVLFVWFTIRTGARQQPVCRAVLAVERRVAFWCRSGSRCTVLRYKRNGRLVQQPVLRECAVRVEPHSLCPRLL